MPIWRGGTYRFAITSANATVGATYSNNSQTFTVTHTISAGTVLFCTGTGAPTASGTLTRTSGTGDATITFSSVTAPNNNWGTSTNWLTDGSGAGVPTNATDATFDNLSLACTVNVTGACRNLNFNSGTGYASTITMTSSINVGQSSPPSGQNMVVTLSASMFVSGTGSINTRILNAGTLTLTSNGFVWPNAFGIINQTSGLGTASTVALADNWTINGLVTIGVSSIVLTFSGAFAINLNGGLTLATVGRIGATSGSISTLRFTGTGTWTQSVVSSGLGLNVDINTSGTLTIANGAIYGGAGTQTGSTFSYTSGTVVTQGTFIFYSTNNNLAYTVNLNGDPSTSATATSSTGVNFNALTFTGNATSAILPWQQINITGNLCSVGTMSVISGGANKFGVQLSGGNIYCNAGLTVNGFILQGTNLSTIRLQGTGTWSENNTLTSSMTQCGVQTNVVVNTTGTITLGSAVGVRSGTFTYTNGSLVYSGFGLRLNGVTLAGFSATGTIPLLQHTTTAASGLGATLTINDSTPLTITNLAFDGFSISFSFVHAGTKGWTANNFNFQQTAAVAAADSSLGLTAGNTYTVVNSFVFNARSLSQQGTGSVMYRVGAGTVYFTLTPGASQNVYVMGATNINSSLGQTIWARKSTITTTQNWNLYTSPQTRFSSFVA